VPSPIIARSFTATRYYAIFCNDMSS